MQFSEKHQECRDDTSCVVFEVPAITCRTCFKYFFSFNSLTSKFCFPKRYIFCMQKRTVVMDLHPYFWILNSIRKMMACWKHNQISFEVHHPVLKYTKIYQNVSYLHDSYFLRYLEYLRLEVPQCRSFR